MAEIASAFVSILPSAKGFGSKLNSQIGGEVDASGKKTGSRFGTALKVGAASAIGGAALGAAAFAKTAVGLEASFSKTMNVLQATTGASAQSMKQLSDLAIKMGADTAFSASDASKAMLELARGGISAAQIQAGALKGTLTLAAAGELDMGEAANTAVKAMGEFGLKGKDMGAIAAALAGGANASSASVRDMGYALSQSGLAAHSAGLSVQETTAILAGFSNQGLEGSDAGTSLKTMLNNLQPATEKAADAFQQLGIFSKETGSKFVKANGEFVSAAKMAELLKKGTEGLTRAEKVSALTTAFGTDAQRAATAMANLGAAGMKKLEKATSDQSAAQKMGAANMKGTAGAIEQLKGSVETVTLQFGLLIAPAVQAGLGLLTKGVNNIVPAVKSLSGVFSGGAGGGLGASFASIGTTVRANFLPVIQAAVATFKTSVLPAIMAVGNYLRANLLPIFAQVGQIIATRVVPIVASLARFFYGTLYPAVLRIVGAIAQQLKPVFDQLFKTIQTTILPAVSRLLARFQQWMPTIQRVVTVVLKVVGTLLVLAATILGKVLPPLIRFAGFLIGKVVGAIGVVVGALIRVIGWIVKVGSAVVNGVQAWVKFQLAVVRVVGTVLRTVAGIPGKITGALGSLGSLLVHAGEELINGISSKIGAIKDKMSEVASAVKGFLPGSPVKEGPLTSWNNGGAGKRLVGMLASGLSDTRPVDRAMNRLSSRIAVASPSLGLDVSAGLTAVAGRSSRSGPVVLRVGDRDMQAWFEENFDGELALL
ncbi:MAG: phage tail tape measure protein [Dermatophilaceae bacterium]|nr:phage tail tape measure protein [Dermatophilaceae bacterium]